MEILIFKHGLLFIGEGSVVRQFESDFSVRARLPSYPLTEGKEFNVLYYLIVLHCQENKLLFY